MQKIYLDTSGGQSMNENPAKLKEELDEKDEIISAQREMIEKFKKLLTKQNTDYAILEDDYSKIVKKSSTKGPIVVVRNIIVRFHQICREGDGFDPYWWPKKWFPSLVDKIV